MDKLSGIAQDYLGSFEILRDARMKLENELHKWWKVLVNDIILPEFKNDPIHDHHWDNQSNPGCLELRTKNKLILRIYDPRQSGTRYYLVEIIGKIPDVTRLHKTKTVVQMLEGMQKDLGCEEYFDRDYRVACLAVDIHGDEPEKTLRSVLDAAKKLYNVIRKIGTL